MVPQSTENTKQSNRYPPSQTHLWNPKTTSSLKTSNYNSIFQLKSIPHWSHLLSTRALTETSSSHISLLSVIEAKEEKWRRNPLPCSTAPKPWSPHMNKIPPVIPLVSKGAHSRFLSIPKLLTSHNPDSHVTY